MAVYCGLVQRSIEIVVIHENVMPLVTDFDQGGEVPSSRSPKQGSPMVHPLLVFTLLQVKLVDVEWIQLESLGEFPGYLQPPHRISIVVELRRPHSDTAHARHDQVHAAARRGLGRHANLKRPLRRLVV